MTNEAAHRYAREKGVSRPLYLLIKAILRPIMAVWFRMRITGAEHIPAAGAAIVAPNHKSFYDSFFLAMATPRHLRFMAKTELINARYGALLVRLGAFPVRRGETDEDALETARVILEQGGLLSLFPEGTRIRDPDRLGEPRRGAGRLALEGGAPIVPAAITGTDDLWLGPMLKPRKVQIAFSQPVSVASLPATPEAAGELVEEQVWPEVERSWRVLRSRRTAAAALVAALGVGGGLGVAAGRRRAAARRTPRARLKRAVQSLPPRAKRRR